LLWSYELACRLDSSGVTVNAVQPGFAATNLEKNSGSFMNSIMFSLVRPMQINAKKAAETSVYLASSSDVEGVSGKCFSDKKEITTSMESYDAEKQKRLWDTTIKLLTLHEN
jgi:NAD(P)-dependent dehydrogenase (short-subunit alcohol dehydrogenase family)